MAKHNCIWQVSYKLGRKKDTLTSPPLRYRWQVMAWILGRKPGASIVSIVPYRTLAAKR